MANLITNILFQDSYNQLSFARCDSYFRNVLDVTVVPASFQQATGRRQLQDQDPGNTANGFANISSTADVSTSSDAALFQVVAECRDCQVTDAGTFQLFDDSFRRALGKLRTPSPGVGRQLQSQASGCTCPINSEPTKPDAPTQEEFRVGYNNAVTELSEQGTLVNVKGVSDIT